MKMSFTKEKYMNKVHVIKLYSCICKLVLLAQLGFLIFFLQTNLHGFAWFILFLLMTEETGMVLPEHLILILSFNSHDSLRRVLLSPFYRRGTKAQRSCQLPKITPLGSDRTWSHQF